MVLAVATEVAVTEVVRQDENEIRLPGLGRLTSCEMRKNRGGGSQEFSAIHGSIHHEGVSCCSLVERSRAIPYDDPFPLGFSAQRTNP